MKGKAKIAMKLEFVPLQGRFVRLEPVLAAMKQDLRVAIECDPDTWATFTVNPVVQGFDLYWSSTLDGIESGQRLAYAIRRLSDGLIVGTSSFMGLRLSQCGVEIGATFLHPDVRGGPVNPECKLLMMEHAFVAGAVRVEFVVDSENARSLAAMLKLGAKQEGLLSSRKIAWNGEVRDVVFFAVTERDWPSVRAKLQNRVAVRG
jgi:N-acetyltransferase